MNGIHDMGGMHGFGAVEREACEPRFHAGWEARILALDILVETAGVYNVDEFRYGIEQMPPAAYLRASYYERWLATAEYNLMNKGLVTRAELEARTELLRLQPDVVLPPPTARPPVSGDPAASSAPAPAPPAPRFAIGDAVMVRNVHPRHHTRMPRYARGKRGEVYLVHAAEFFPDTNAHGLGQDPQPVYSVRFESRELWGSAASPNETVNIDLWESYLEPAPGGGSAC